LIANPDSEKFVVSAGRVTDRAENKAAFAVMMADFLLKELDKPTPNEGVQE